MAVVPTSRSTGALTDTGLLDVSYYSPERQNENPRIALLRQCPFFSFLGKKVLEKIAGSVKHSINLKPSETLSKKGKEVDSIYIIQKGEIEVSIDGIALEVIGTGRTVGELGLFTSEPSHVSATAKTAATVLSIPKTGFEGLIQSNRQLMKGMLLEFSESIKRNNQTVGLNKISREGSSNSSVQTPRSANSIDSARQHPGHKDNSVQEMYQLYQKIMEAEFKLEVKKSERRALVISRELEILDFESKLIAEQGRGSPLASKLKSEKESKAATNKIASDSTNSKSIKSSIKIERYKITLILKFYEYCKDLPSRFSLNECLKLMCCSAYLQKLRPFFPPLKSICDEYLRQMNQDSYKLYQEALIILNHKDQTNPSEIHPRVNLNVVQEIIKKIELISRFYLFHLPFSEKLKIALCSERVQEEENSTLFKEGEEVTSMYFLEGGEVKVHNGEKDLYVLKPGDNEGEGVLLNPGMYKSPSSATVLKKSVFLRINLSNFNQLLDDLTFFETIFRVAVGNIKRSQEARYATLKHYKESEAPFIPIERTKTPKEIKHLDLKFERRERLDENNVFSRIDSEETVHKDLKKQLQKVRGSIEECWKKDETIETIFKYIHLIKKIEKNCKVEKLALELSRMENVVRSFIPSNHVEFTKITVNGEVIISEKRRYDSQIEFFQFLLSKLYPKLKEEQLESTAKNIIKGKTVLPEDEKEYLTFQPIPCLNLLKACSHSSSWITANDYIRKQLLPTYHTAPYFGFYVKGVECSISMKSAEDFIVNITKWVSIVQESTRNTRMEEVYATIPFEHTIVFKDGEWKTDVTVSHDHPIEHGCNLKIYGEILRDLYIGLMNRH